MVIDASVTRLCHSVCISKLQLLAVADHVRVSDRNTIWHERVVYHVHMLGCTSSWQELVQLVCWHCLLHMLECLGSKQLVLCQ